MVVWYVLMGLCALVYAYGWTMWELNWKSLQWFNMISLGREEGNFTDEDVEYFLDNPPWFVKLTKKIDITHKLPERWFSND